MPRIVSLVLLGELSECGRHPPKRFPAYPQCPVPALSGWLCTWSCFPGRPAAAAPSRPLRLLLLRAWHWRRSASPCNPCSFHRIPWEAWGAAAEVLVDLVIRRDRVAAAEQWVRDVTTWKHGLVTSLPSRPVRSPRRRRQGRKRATMSANREGIVAPGHFRRLPARTSPSLGRFAPPFPGSHPTSPRMARAALHNCSKNRPAAFLG